MNKLNLLGTSAWYAPGAAAAQMVEAIIKADHVVFPCCVLMTRVSTVSSGLVPRCSSYSGKNGVEKVIELDQRRRKCRPLLKEKVIRDVKKPY